MFNDKISTKYGSLLEKPTIYHIRHVTLTRIEIFKFPLRERVWMQYIHFPEWRSTTRGSTNCLIVGTPGFFASFC